MQVFKLPHIWRAGYRGRCKVARVSYVVECDNAVACVLFGICCCGMDYSVKMRQMIEDVGNFATA